MLKRLEATMERQWKTQNEFRKRIEVLDFLNKNKKWPLILKGVNIHFFKNTVVLDANREKVAITPDLDGFIIPKWFLQLKTINAPLLVIKNLDTLSCLKQENFIELLKHRRISSLELPTNCQIILLADFNKISKTICNLCLLKEF